VPILLRKFGIRHEVLIPHLVDHVELIQLLYYPEVGPYVRVRGIRVFVDDVPVNVAHALFEVCGSGGWEVWVGTNEFSRAPPADQAFGQAATEVMHLVVLNPGVKLAQSKRCAAAKHLSELAPKDGSGIGRVVALIIHWPLATRREVVMLVVVRRGFDGRGRERVKVDEVVEVVHRGFWRRVDARGSCAIAAGGTEIGLVGGRLADVG
jgi:hypothetical protein